MRSTAVLCSRAAHPASSRLLPCSLHTSYELRALPSPPLPSPASYVRAPPSPPLPPPRGPQGARLLAGREGPRRPAGRSVPRQQGRGGAEGAPQGQRQGQGEGEGQVLMRALPALGVPALGVPALGVPAHGHAAGVAAL
jgi:hypothetical protein